MKFLITGAKGFIGKNLVAYHKEQGNEIVELDRNLFLDFEKLRKFVVKEAPEVIIHLAAYGNHFNQGDIDQIVASNIMGTYILLRASEDVPFKAFINVSSSSVYGIKDEKMKEMDSLDTDTFYGATKVAGEYLARAFAKRTGRPIVNVRPFSIFGEGEAEHRFIPTVIRSMIKGEPLDVEADTPHDWLYIGDFLLALDAVIDNAEKLKGEVINIGSGTSLRNEELVEMLKIMSGRLFFNYNKVKNLREYQPIVWQADTEFIESFGWKPTDFSQNIQKTLAYYEQMYNPEGFKEHVHESDKK